MNARLYVCQCLCIAWLLPMDSCSHCIHCHNSWVLFYSYWWHRRSHTQAKWKQTNKMRQRNWKSTQQKIQRTHSGFNVDLPRNSASEQGKKNEAIFFCSVKWQILLFPIASCSFSKWSIWLCVTYEFLGNDNKRKKKQQIMIHTSS